MDNKEFIDNKYILCEGNSGDLAAFLSLFVDFTVSRRALEDGMYYSIDGFSKGIAKASKEYAFKEADAERILLYNLDSIKYEYNNNIFRVPIRPASINKNSIRESGNIIESVDNIISVNSPRSFPRVMWVKDLGDSVDTYVQRIVINKLIDKYVAVYGFETFKDYHVSGDAKYRFQVWDEAIELEDLTVLTKEDIAKLTNTTVDKLKIIE